MDEKISINTPKYLILLHHQSKIIYANNLTDAIQIIMFNKSYATIYQKKWLTDEAFKYLFDITFEYTEDEDENKDEKQNA